MIDSSPVIKKIKIEDLKPAPYNPREINSENKKALKESLSRYGLVELLIWNENTGHIVGGNQRLSLLQEQKVSEVDVICINLSLEDEKLLNVTLNNPHAQGEFSDFLGNVIADIGSEEELLETLNIPNLLSDYDIDLVSDIPFEELPETEATEKSETVEKETADPGDNIGTTADGSENQVKELEKDKVRTIQLYLELDEFEVFQHMTKALQKEHGYEGITETILNSLKESFDKLA